MDEKPYQRRVREVIEEELVNAGIKYDELPERVQGALELITTRLAADLEFLHDTVQRQDGARTAEAFCPNPLVYYRGSR